MVSESMFIEALFGLTNPAHLWRPRKSERNERPSECGKRAVSGLYFRQDGLPEDLNGGFWLDCGFLGITWTLYVIPFLGCIAFSRHQCMADVLVFRMLPFRNS